MEEKSSNNILSKSNYYCSYCDYSCNKSFLYKQHCNTKKHLLKLNHNDDTVYNYTCKCGKTYKHKQSFKRHVKNCNRPQNNVQLYTSNEQKYTNETDDLKSIINSLITQNRDMLMENKEMREMVNEMIPKIGNNNTTIQNKFNLQIFLNEKCKDAINLTEFVNTLELECEDLDNTGKNGYITGITDIFVKGLRQIEMYKRPIHL